VAVIGEDVRKSLFLNENPIGKKIRFEGQSYTIIGLMEPRGSIFGQSQDRMILVPYTRLLQLYGGAEIRSIGIQVQAPDMTRITATMDELIGIMRSVRKVEPGKENDFEVVTNNSISSVFDSFTGVLNIFGVVVGGIALLGAGIGVMNIMLVSVTERTREIGIRKSVGATKKAIRQQFIIEAIFICQLGGIIGIILGMIGGNLLAVVMDARVVVPWMSAFMGLVMMTLIGLVFGVYPAVKAASLDPIESLRYE
jgi:putative ABC transport system permease protein